VEINGPVCKKSQNPAKQNVKDSGSMNYIQMFGIIKPLTTMASNMLSISGGGTA
jgi:hypothetical protein